LFEIQPSFDLKLSIVWTLVLTKLLRLIGPQSLLVKTLNIFQNITTLS